MLVRSQSPGGTAVLNVLYFRIHLEIIQRVQSLELQAEVSQVGQC